MRAAMTNGNAPDFAKRIRKHAARPGSRRFYRSVTVTGGPDGFGVALDRQPLRTPGRAPFALPSRALAEAIAEEWAAQGEHVVPATMGLTRLANTALDRVAGREHQVTAEIVAYAGCDLLCYRAESPERLAARQAAAWDPLLAWAARALGSPFLCVTGVVHHSQPAAALDVLARELERQGPLRLAAAHNITTLTGSAIMALALLEGAISAEAAWTAAHVDEDWQIEQWGRDSQAEAARAARRREFDCAVRLFELV